ncbi:outer membrane protein transport protein [candidate division KSB1 bacterium]|nr:outer membrane protein transport protein [candidate division KSB1 bacterium]
MRRRIRNFELAFISILVCIFFFTPGLSFGQRPPVPPINLSYFRVDFLQAGARSAALGGAFIGAAQDETAAPINPAGLTYLKSAGASLHQRVGNLDFEEPEGAAAAANRKTGFSSHIFDQNLAVVFFPIKRFTFALLRQVGFDNRFAFETQQFLTTESLSTTRQLLGGLGNFPGRKVDLNLRLVNDGISVAYRISKRLSLGVTGKISVLNLRLNEQTFLDPLIAGGGSPGENRPENTYSITTIDERVTDPSFSFGVMSKIILDKLFVGAVLNLNPSFALNSNIFLPEYKIGTQTFLPESANPEFKFSVPNNYGFGLYYVPKSGIRFTFDVVRVQYSDLLGDNDLNIIADDELNPETGMYEDPDGRPDLTIDDATEFHAGIEFLVRPRMSFVAKRFSLIPIRIGVHTNPGHRIYATGNNPDLKRLFPKAKDRVHFSFGTGFVLNSYLKFDGSITISADSFEFIASTLIALPL